MYTLRCVKLIAGERLLYDTESSVCSLRQPRGVGWGIVVGGRLKKEKIDVYFRLIHIVGWQKPTQHCKAVILQLKISAVKVSQSCLTLYDPMDYSVHGILQAGILEWVVSPFSRGSSQPRDQFGVGSGSLPVFFPGESQGPGSLVGCHQWGRTESDTTEAT